MGEKPVYELGAHPYPVKIKNYKNSNFSTETNLITSPLNLSGEYCFNNLEITCFCDSKSLAGTLNNQIPKCSYAT